MALPLLGLAARGLAMGGRLLGRSAMTGSVRTNVGQAGPDLAKKTSQAVNELGIKLTKNLKLATPIDKGRARNGWKRTSGRRGFSIRNRVEYIGALNEGHSRQAKREYVGTTIDKTIRTQKI